MEKKEDYKNMLKDKSSVFTPENEVTLNEYNPNKYVLIPVILRCLHSGKVLMMA